MKKIIQPIRKLFYPAFLNIGLIILVGGMLAFVGLRATTVKAAPGGPEDPQSQISSEPMGESSENTLCVNHTWVDLTNYSINGTVGSSNESHPTGRSKLTFPDHSVKYAFCTDIYNSVGDNQPYCLDSGFYSDWRIAWLVNNYPPSIDKEFNAARQAAVWHFSDSFNLKAPPYTTTPEDSTINQKVWNHYNAILAAIPTEMPPEYEAGNVSLTITPQNATNFLPGQEEHPFTVTLLKGSKPLAGKTIQVATAFGTLNAPSAVTDANGQAAFTVTSNITGTATLTATAEVIIPAGSRFVHQNSPLSSQRLVLGEPVTTTVQAQATKTWEKAANLIIAHKFEDKNYNGVQDAGEPNLSTWQFTLLTPPGGITSTATTDSQGKAYFYDQINANGTYTLTETLQNNWTNSTSLNQSKERTESDQWTQWIAEFGNAQYSLITVIKYEDNNNNQQMDSGEPVLPGWQFYLYKYKESEGNWTQLSGGTTGADGSLSFSDLAAGKYKVVESLLSPDYQSTTGLEQAFTLGYPEHKTLSFGNRRYDMDYGDLPEYYQLTWFANNGARHKPLTSGDVWLGDQRDAEFDGYQSPDANGDDTNGTPNDEDGVVRGAGSWGSGTGTISVTVTGPSCLMGWLDYYDLAANDFGPDYQFTDSFTIPEGTFSEKIIDNLYVPAGTTPITFTLPSGFKNTGVYARFRLSPYDATQGQTEGICNQTPAGLTGLVLGGEVEDYFWLFGPTAIQLQSFKAQPVQTSGYAGPIVALLAVLSLISLWIISRRVRS